MILKFLQRLKRKENHFLPVWFVFFVYWHINICGLFNAKAILVEEQQYYITHSWGNKEIHAFHKSISPYVNEIEWLDFEIAYYVCCSIVLSTLGRRDSQ